MIIELPWPPSVGVYMRVFKNRLVKTSRARDYCHQVHILARGREKFGDKRLAVSILAFPPDRRKRDLDNLLKVTLDSMEKCGLYDDDNQIDRIVIERREVKKGGWLRVNIEEIKGEI